MTQPEGPNQEELEAMHEEEMHAQGKLTAEELAGMEKHSPGADGASVLGVRTLAKAINDFEEAWAGGAPKAKDASKTEAQLRALEEERRADREEKRRADREEKRWLADVEGVKAKLHAAAEAERTGVPQQLLDTLEPQGSITDILSDFLQSTKAILWNVSGSGSTVLEAKGIGINELEWLLLALAADVHERRTGTRVGAIVLSRADISLLKDLYFRPGSLSDKQGLVLELMDKLTRLVRERVLR